LRREGISMTHNGTRGAIRSPSRSRYRPFCQSHVAIALSSSDHQPLVYATSAPRRPTLLSALVSPIYLSPYIPRTPLASEWLDAQWHSWQLGSYFYNARSSPTRPRSHPVLRSHLAAHGLSSCVITSTFDYRVPSSQSLLASDML
jgi:hypothetical protein